ncbi:MAG: efflux RND transporter periplasmic adaptor subunit [bacterium]|jgi:multidrug efflux pump subunit AcrA (membrane-fusion protein)
MKRALIIIIVVAVAVLIVFWRMSSIQKERQAREEAAAAAEAVTSVTVEVAPVITGEIEKALRYTGRVEAAEEVDVTPKIAGRVIEVHVREGDSVRKGQTVMTIDPEVTGMKFEPNAVTSPIDGKVAIRYVDRGAYVTQQVPLLKVINDASVKVTVGILEKDCPFVRLGMPARIEFDALPGKEYTAEVSNIRPMVDVMTGTARAEINMKNGTGKLRTGMFARVQLVVETHKSAVLMPRDATLRELFSDRGAEIETEVFVAEGGFARKREVHLGLSNRDYFEVLDGLEPGDEVIVAGQTIVKDGSEIDVRRAPSGS